MVDDDAAAEGIATVNKAATPSRPTTIRLIRDMSFPRRFNRNSCGYHSELRVRRVEWARPAWCGRPMMFNPSTTRTWSAEPRWSVPRQRRSTVRCSTPSRTPKGPLSRSGDFFVSSRRRARKVPEIPGEARCTLTLQLLGSDDVQRSGPGHQAAQVSGQSVLPSLAKR